MNVRKVFIDCGSNKGKITRDFLEKGNTDFEYFLFEPLLYFHENNIGDVIREDYPDIKLTYSAEAVWIRDEELKFFICGRGNEGSSICENKVSNRMDHKNPLLVQGIDFSKWIISNFSKDDYIVCKMDIEGAEYDVLPKMITDGSIEYLNKMIIEFHGRKQLKGEYIHERYTEIRNYFKTNNIELISHG